MSKIFNDIPMERAEVLFNNDLDASALKLFYDNCIRMGSGDNLNVTTATIHPVIWFSDFLFPNKYHKSFLKFQIPKYLKTFNFFYRIYLRTIK